MNVSACYFSNIMFQTKIVLYNSCKYEIQVCEKILPCFNMYNEDFFFTFLFIENFSKYYQ
ncbi:hypothetical protein XENTR_v10018554 [Xenopus tropicalis]|nr:hypothetical protein XENTR_v10018554 [Xenopus tropicalis]